MRRKSKPSSQQLVLFPETIGMRPLDHCEHCGADWRRGKNPDPCIGWLSDVDSCCCGHGETEEAYVDPAGSWAEAATAGSDWERRWQILNRYRLRGEAALAFLADRGCGPETG
jgi:hypothetical protein